ncbi:MAG TPA: carboxypeptidase-like regulatory domain-containing protein [Acidobacteriaceae bacterium]|nr:carboxypeptidase-like regulatory domain-containing protein [Acidobacteriaceae bacterium]
MKLFHPRKHGLSTLLQLVALTVFALLLPSLTAQIAGTGTIQGTVTDQTGAFIPKATVTLTEQSTQVARTISTDESGVYVFPNIKPGTYTVAIAAPGFANFAQKNNVLEVGSNIAVNVQMKVAGAKGESVEVSANGLALQTEDVSYKQTIDAKEITELPLNSASRQITGLLTMSGGTNPAPAGDFTGSKYSYQTISISVAGGSGNTTLWRLDGGDNNDYMGNGNLPFPFPDAVSQFSVESSVLGAQDGMHSGGLVNVVTRSGTNTYHGSAFEFIRNNFLDASNFFASCTPVAPAKTCSPKDTLHQNQYGGTFGGRILRDRLFAFAGYQRLKADQSSAATKATVPTAANLLGDFSVTDPPPGSTNTTCGKPVQLYDPITGALLPGNKYPTPPTFNAASLALQKLLPKIDPSYDTGNCGFVSYAIPNEQFDNEFVTRVDFTINDKNHFYARYFIDGYQSPAFFSPTNILITTQSGNVERVQTYTMGEDWTVDSNIVNSAHATLLRRSNNRGYAANDINANTLGVSLYQAEPNGLQMSEGKFTIGGGTNSVSHFNDNTLALDDDITMLHGKHQFVFGGEFVWNQLNISNAYESNGTFTFNGTFSGSGPQGGSKVGDQNLDFLMGTLSAFQQSKMQQNALRAPIPSIYFQDTYHATKQLTVIAGIRWSPEWLPFDVFNRGTVFNYNAFLANQVSKVYPNAPAGTFFYGDPGVPRAFTEASPWQFSPNVGLAYDISGKGTSVIRAGFEIIYDQVNFFTGQRTQQNPPFATAISQIQTSTSGPINFAAPWSAGSITTSPFPQPAVPTPAQAQFFPQSQYIVLPTQFKPSYTEQWTASVQHQFPHDWQMQVDYIGNHTVHDPMGTPLSPAIYVPGNWGPGGTGCPGVVTTGPAGKPAGAAGTPCSTVANQAQRFALTVANPAQGNQYLGGGGGSVMVNDIGMANYNGMIATLQHRLSNTFSVLANYTWSKCLNIYDAQGDYAGTNVENPNDISRDYGPCGSDFRNVTNLVLVLRSNFHSMPAAARYAINGWEFAGGPHISSGVPFTVTTGTDISLTDIGNDRPNLVPGQPIYLHTAIRSGTGGVNRSYLNPAAFCATSTTASPCPDPVAPGTYGDIGRNSFRGPRIYNFDAQVSRVFPIHERLAMQLRLEAFNLLNHPDFNPPSGATTGTMAGNSGSAAALSSSTFGQISSTINTARVFQGSIKLSF